MPGFEEWISERNIQVPEIGSDERIEYELLKEFFDGMTSSIALMMDVGIIPKDEQWLHDNKEAIESVKLGLNDSANGEVVDRTF